ncbi:MAG: hypothetical protein AAGI90_03765 [Chlamydiota bacterium]
MSSSSVSTPRHSSQETYSLMISNQPLDRCYTEPYNQPKLIHISAPRRSAIPFLGSDSNPKRFGGRVFSWWQSLFCPTQISILQIFIPMTSTLFSSLAKSHSKEPTYGPYYHSPSFKGVFWTLVYDITSIVSFIFRLIISPIFFLVDMLTLVPRFICSIVCSAYLCANQVSSDPSGKVPHSIYKIMEEAVVFPTSREHACDLLQDVLRAKEVYCMEYVGDALKNAQGQIMKYTAFVRNQPWGEKRHTKELITPLKSRFIAFPKPSKGNTVRIVFE